MAEGRRNSKFYVVGGPVRPDHACYVVREADAGLYTRLRDGEYCSVLAPRQTGKTSLMIRAARRLRSEGTDVAVVDLSQIGGRDGAQDKGRWYYSLAYRIVRELRIRTELQSWWHDHSGLTNQQRLRDFFRDLVLPSSTRPIVIFVDRAEMTLDAAFAANLYAAARACFDERATETEFQRLTFAFLGTAAAQELVPDSSQSPFPIATEIGLGDFRRDEMATLGQGLGREENEARAITDSVWKWTAGHPYMSQKLLRALARRRAATVDAELVDEQVRTLFLNRNATREEAHLSQISELLLREPSRRVQRLTLYGRIRKGAQVLYDPASEPQRELLVSGLVVERADGTLGVRNRIYRHAFTARWANQNLPFGWRGLVAAVAISAFIIGVPVWYSEILPRPYIEVLTDGSQDYASADEAYAGLSGWPGFGGTAERLYADYLEEQSLAAESLNGLRVLLQRLAKLPGQESRVAALEAAFWDRRSVRAAFAGDRDAALLYRLRALRDPAPERRSALGELIGDDYRQLVSTIRMRAPVSALAVDTDRSLLTLVDAGHNVETWHLGVTPPTLRRSGRLVAEENSQVQRRLVVDGIQTATRLNVMLDIDHPAPAQVEVEIRAPAGRRLRLRLDAAGVEADGSYKFDSRTTRSLTRLLEGDIGGTWTAYVADAASGLTGQFRQWSIGFDGQEWRSETDLPGVRLEIPEPGIVEDVVTELDPSGVLALLWPADITIRGSLLIYDIGTGRVAARIPRDEEFISAQFVLGGSAVMSYSAGRVELWAVEDGQPLGVIPVPGIARVEPRLADGGRFLLIDTRPEEGGSTIDVWDLSDVRRTARLSTGQSSTVVAVSSDGQRVALGDDEEFIRLFDAATGELTGEFPHHAQPTWVGFDPTGTRVASVDVQGTLYLWNPLVSAEPLAELSRKGQWRIGWSQAYLIAGTADSSYRLIDADSGRMLGPALRTGNAAASNDPASLPEPFVAAGLGIAVTAETPAVLRIWRLPEFVAATATDPRGREPRVVAISPDGGHVAIAARGGYVQIFPAANLTGVASDIDGPRYIGHSATVNAIAFDSKGQRVASGAIDGTVRIWDAENGAPLPFFVRVPDGEVRSLAYQTDDNQIAVVGRQSAHIIDAANGNVMASLQARNDVTCVAPDVQPERTLLCISGEGIVRWTWRSGERELLVPAEALLHGGSIDTSGQHLLAAGAQTLWLAGIEDGSRVMPDESLLRGAEHFGFIGDGRVYVQNGPWLRVLESTDGNLVPVQSTLLPVVPIALRPSGPGRLSWLGFGVDGYMVIGSVVPGKSAATPLEGPAGDLLTEWQARLQLELDEFGMAVSRRGE